MYALSNIAYSLGLRPQDYAILLRAYTWKTPGRRATTITSMKTIIARSIAYEDNRGQLQDLLLWTSMLAMTV